jgi:N-acyl amino acid synthase of PEP-CTERM/exosortase system
LRPEQFPDGLERDEYDDASEHYLIRHRRTGIYAATTRLILPDLEHPQRLFPTERLASRLVLPQRQDETFRKRLAEVSRLCVSKDFKRRRGEWGSITGLESADLQTYPLSEDERRSFPHIIHALLACLVRASVSHNITHWYGFMEVSLTRLFAVLGIHWTVIGSITDFHGRRQPCFIEISDLLDTVKKRNSQVWDILTDHGRYWRDSARSAAACCPRPSAEQQRPQR